MAKCLLCGKEIKDPPWDLIFFARQCGKSRTIMYYWYKNMCCSNECFMQWIDKAEQIFNKMGE